MKELLDHFSPTAPLLPGFRWVQRGTVLDRPYYVYETEAPPEPEKHIGVSFYYGFSVTVNWKRGPAEVFRNVSRINADYKVFRRLMLESEEHKSGESLQIDEMDGYEATAESCLAHSFWEGRKQD